MTRVLLITDTERVQRIFEALEAKGSLQLRTAATLDQADLEISATVPDFTFVQSRVSGFSGEIQLRHLKKVLPKGAKAILLSGDAVDAAQAKKERKPFIDLALDDEELAESVSKVLTGARSASPKKALPKKADSVDAVPAPKSRVAKAKDSIPAPSSVPEETTVPPFAVSEKTTDPAPISVPEDWGKAEEPLVQEPLVDLPALETIKPIQEEQPADLPEQETIKPILEEPPADLPAQETIKPILEEPFPDEAPFADPPAPGIEKHRAQPFDEILQLGTARVSESALGSLNVEDRVNLGKPPYRPIEVSDNLIGSYQQETADPLPDGYSQGIPLADAMARAEKEKRRYRWVLPVLLAFLLVPLLSYLAGKKEAPVQSGPATGVSRTVKPTDKAPAPATAEAPVQATKPAPNTPSTPSAKAASTPTAKTENTPKTADTPKSANTALSRALAATLNTVPTMSPILLPTVPPAKVAAPAANPAASATVPAPAKPAASAAVTAQAAAPALVQAAAPAKAAAPAPAKAAAPAPPLATKPEVKPTAKPEVKQAAKPVPEPEVKPVAKAGIKSLPPVVTSAKLDSAYGKTHPGWQRYVGQKAEYTVFKEDNMFRAMQVIALGKETIPNQLFRRLLLEFGGVKRFRLESTTDKGDYVMERGVAKGGLSLTVYRKKTDLKVKGLVLYYQ